MKRKAITHRGLWTKISDTWRTTAPTFAALLAAQAIGAQTASHCDDVNLFIGTGGHGHTTPAALVPHGMIQPGPDTRIHGWDACSGYHYTDSLINGFAHTRLSGTGCADFGDFLLMPFTGKPDLRYVGEKNENVQHVAFASAFSHHDEHAEPGYYSVMLKRYGIQAELTATARTAMHRYTFPKDLKGEAGVILDLDYAIQEQTNQMMDCLVPDAHTVRAFRRSAWWAYRQDIYLEMQFSQPVRRYELMRDTVTAGEKREPRCKLVLYFDLKPGDTLLAKAAISSVDAEGAARNLHAEQPAWDFDGTRRKARLAWEEKLGCIDIKTRDRDTRSIFYTALYHAQIAPALFADTDGRYLGNDLQIHQGSTDDPMYTFFSLWDTFRALHPLLSIIAPQENAAYIRQLVQKGKDGGLVPKWDCVGNYTGCMIGYHLASLVADAQAKGIGGFDLQTAYEAVCRAAEYSIEGIAPAVPQWLYPYIMPMARHYKETRGYIPSDLEKEAVAKALEYAYDDWCIARLAQAVGDNERAARYAEYAKAYRLYFDPQTGFMRGKTEKGEWRTPFDPYSSNHRNDDYCEGNAWQWSWFVPHDVEGLAALYGGKAQMAARLDSLFAAPSLITGSEVSADISGLIGQYAHGNEPSHHIIHLYNYVDCPHRTQELADSVLRTLYRNAPDGLSGNEDCGQMSAWYLLNAMGFYQVCPGRPVYSIGRPIVDEATIKLPNGRTFTVQAKHNAPTRKYIRSMRLNGHILSSPFFTHTQLMEGGVLELEMAERP